MQTNLITLHILNKDKKPFCGAERKGKVRFVSKTCRSRKNEIFCTICLFDQFQESRKKGEKVV